MNFTKRQIEIIEKATILIGEKGIQNLTTKKLAEQMNFSEPALYRHFKNKTEILKSVLYYYKAKLKDGLTKIIETDKNALEKIELMIDFQFNYFTNHPEIIMVIFSETSFQYNIELSNVVLKIIEKKSEIVKSILNNGIKENIIRIDISSEQLTNIVLGTMRFSVLKWRLSNYSFDLKKEGFEISNALRATISITK